MHGVEAQPVEPVTTEPMQRILGRECAHLRHAIIDGAAPWRVRRCKKGGRVAREIIAFWTEMIVDDIKKNHETARMRGVDQGLEVFGPAIGAVRRVEERSVIAPI